MIEYMSEMISKWSGTRLPPEKKILGTPIGGKEACKIIRIVDFQCLTHSGPFSSIPHRKISVNQFPTLAIFF